MSKIKKHAEDKFGEAWEQDLLDQIENEATKLEEDARVEFIRNRPYHPSLGPSESHNELRLMQDQLIREVRDYEYNERSRYGD